MSRLLAGFWTFLVFCSAYAVDVKDAPIPTESNVIGIVVFLVLAVGSCVGFIGYIFWADKNKKHDDEPKA